MKTVTTASKKAREPHKDTLILALESICRWTQRPATNDVLFTIWQVATKALEELDQKERNT